MRGGYRYVTGKTEKVFKPYFEEKENTGRGGKPFGKTVLEVHLNAWAVSGGTQRRRTPER